MERVIRIKRGVVLHVHDDERKASNPTKAFTIGAERATRRRELYEGRDAKRLGRFKCIGDRQRIPE